MSRKYERIDFISSLSKNLSFNDLRFQHGTGQAILLSGRGYDKKYGYRSGIQTEVGDIREDVWCQAMHELIERSGEKALYENLLEWVTENTHWIKTKHEAEQEALQLHSYRIFDNSEWVGYISFNKRYRPEISI